MATLRNAAGQQISPYPCEDDGENKGCGAKSGEPCTYRSHMREKVGQSRTTLHWFRPRPRSDGFRQESPTLDEAAEEQTQSPAIVEQPPPTPNLPHLPSAHDLVIQDMEARKALGLARYGQLLQPFNGRDALVDAYQEALDMAVYLRVAIEERDRADREDRERLDQMRKSANGASS